MRADGMPKSAVSPTAKSVGPRTGAASRNDIGPRPRLRAGRTSRPRCSMAEPKATVPLSVIVSTVREPGSLLARFQDLRRQLRSLDGQLIISSTAAPDAPPPPGVTFHQIAGGSVFDCRAA